METYIGQPDRSKEHDTFLELMDTPSSFLNEANALLKVNAAEDALVFAEWKIDANGHLVPDSDNARDIGNDTAGVRDIFLSGEFASCLVVSPFTTSRIATICGSPSIFGTMSLFATSTINYTAASFTNAAHIFNINGSAVDGSGFLIQLANGADRFNVSANLLTVSINSETHNITGADGEFLINLTAIAGSDGNLNVVSNGSNIFFLDGTNVSAGFRTITPSSDFAVDIAAPVRIREAHALFFGGTGSALSTTASIDVPNAGIFRFFSRNNTNNENLAIDLETVENEIGLSSSSGATLLNASTLNFRAAIIEAYQNRDVIKYASMGA